MYYPRGNSTLQDRLNEFEQYKTAYVDVAFAHLNAVVAIFFFFLHASHKKKYDNGRICDIASDIIIIYNI